MIKPSADDNPLETHEWLESLEAVIQHDGTSRAGFIIDALLGRARLAGVTLKPSGATPYLNTIHLNDEAHCPGDRQLEDRICSLVRWNALAMVVSANARAPGIGGHIASFASAAMLYDVAWNHFFKGPDHPDGADLVYFQGHSSPGVYARAFLEGRLTHDELANFRQETTGGGLSSYPHPRLGPSFWQFPTVSMGLGPMMAIYQARFMRYLQNRGLIPASKARVWVFLGDGEMDEPESVGALSLAAREKLDNLTFVINCNLQRLDGPVRGNGKVIQELEQIFRGAGWKVFKVIWAGQWDPLIARDKAGALLRRMEEAVDGDYQNCAARDGAWTRQNFFGRDPKVLELVAGLTDAEVKGLDRGGHDPQKVYAAYHAATRERGGPTCILAKTVKGHGIGSASEANNGAHQLKTLDVEALKAFRDRYQIPIDDERIADTPLYKPRDDSPELRYLHERRRALGGYVPSRKRGDHVLAVPALNAFESVLRGSGERPMSTTMACVRILTLLTRNKEIGRHIVPIVPDEARTFGMEGLFRQLGIYASHGQLYEPVDSAELMYYREDKKGQILEEGICEAGAVSSFIAAGTSYANYGVPMIPFYAFYSMFGFQRVGDFLWAAADGCARGFLIGATSGRTTLAGEGLQHTDGHSHVLASTIPTCRSYDPAYGYELAVIVQDGLRRMFGEQEDVFFYITVTNEQYPMPALPENTAEGILRGMYLLRPSSPGQQRVQLLGSGAILGEVIAAAEILEADFGVKADVWSVTSFTELRRDGLAAQRRLQLHPEESSARAYVESALEQHPGPVIAATDYMRIHADQIRPFVPRRYVTLGTDGFGRSDTRERLRRFFEVDRYHVAYAAIHALHCDGEVPASLVLKARAALGIDPEKSHPLESI